MLNELKVLEDKLYLPEALAAFLQVPPPHPALLPARSHQAAQQVEQEGEQGPHPVLLFEGGPEQPLQGLPLRLPHRIKRYSALDVESKK